MQGWNIKRGKAKDGDSQDDLSWAACPRHPHRNSPMTKFVDDMALTNREFSLY